MVSPPAMSNYPPPTRFSPPGTGTETPSEREHSRRRGSFSFLNRTKSGTQFPTVSRLSRKRGPSKEREASKEPIPSAPPQIPDIPRPVQLQTFGGENAKPAPTSVASSRLGTPLANNMSFNIYSNVPIPPIPTVMQDRGGEYQDPNGRTDSMTHRGRYSYANNAIGTINSPRRMRRRRDPTPFKYVCWGARLCFE